MAKISDMTELTKKYELGKILGEGITGQVRLVTSKKDGSVCAMKSLNVAKMDPHQLQELKLEIELLNQLDHPNVVSLFEVFESSDNISLVMEHCCGGDLSRRRYTTEAQVQSVVYQLTEAVAHCHYVGIVHRDLKMENIMFVSPDSDSLRLIDFGLAAKYRGRVAWGQDDGNEKKRVMQTACGTAYYMAPEMLDEDKYTEKVDVWAIGVISFMLVTGRPPFEGMSEKAVFQKIRRGQCAFHSSVWGRLSPQATSFTKSLLTVEPRKRPSAREALDLPWLSKYGVTRFENFLEEDSGKLTKAICASLIRFSTYNPLKKAALMIVAHHANEKDLRELREVFLALDHERSGQLTFDEMNDYLKRFSGQPITKNDALSVFAKLDQSKSGAIHFMDFLSATVEARCEITSQLLHQAFDHLDADGSGCINVENLQELLGKRFSRTETAFIIESALMEHHIETADGKISREQFIDMMTDATELENGVKSNNASSVFTITPAPDNSRPTSAIGDVAVSDATISPQLLDCDTHTEGSEPAQSMFEDLGTGHNLDPSDRSGSIASAMELVTTVSAPPELQHVDAVILVVEPPPLTTTMIVAENGI